MLAQKNFRKPLKGAYFWVMEAQVGNTFLELQGIVDPKY